MYYSSRGMAELSSPALLLDRRSQRRCPEGRRGTSCLTTVDQRPAPPARGITRAKAFSAQWTQSCSHRNGPARAQLRRRDFLSRPRIDECGETTPGKAPVRVNIGLTDAFPKLIAFQILRAAFRSEAAVHMICREGNRSTRESPPGAPIGHCARR